MRSWEIEFRCYWLKEKRYVKLHSIHFGTKKVIITYRNGNISLPFSEAVLEQYIGLKDKNGKKIYEGDIVSVHNKNHKNEYDIGIVEFRKGAFRCPFLLGKYQSGQVEVISNVHENPELLEVKNE